MNFLCKFWHRHVIRRPRFPVTVQNFGDLATFSVDFFYNLYAECPPYFYFRFVWPTDLERIPHATTPHDNSHQVWSWYDHPLPSYSVFVCPGLPIHYTTSIGLRRRLKLSHRNGSQNGVFLGGMGVETLDSGFATPKRNFLARNRVVWRFLRQNRCARLGCSLSKEPPLPENSRVTLCRGARNHACAEPKPLNRFE